MGGLELLLSLRVGLRQRGRASQASQCRLQCGQLPCSAEGWNRKPGREGWRQGGRRHLTHYARLSAVVRSSQVGGRSAVGEHTAGNLSSVEV